MGWGVAADSPRAGLPTSSAGTPRRLARIGPVARSFTQLADVDLEPEDGVLAKLLAMEDRGSQRLVLIFDDAFILPQDAAM